MYQLYKITTEYVTQTSDYRICEWPFVSVCLNIILFYLTINVLCLLYVGVHVCVLINLCIYPHVCMCCLLPISDEWYYRETFVRMVHYIIIHFVGFRQRSSTLFRSVIVIDLIDFNFHNLMWKVTSSPLHLSYYLGFYCFSPYGSGEFSNSMTV